MYAIIDNGNKQYKVAEGDVIRLEKLAAAEGETVSFKVLMVADESGIKTGAEVESAKVTATVVEHAKAKKIIVASIFGYMHNVLANGSRLVISQPIKNNFEHTTFSKTAANISCEKQKLHGDISVFTICTNKARYDLTVTFAA